MRKQEANRLAGPSASEEPERADAEMGGDDAPTPGAHPERGAAAPSDAARLGSAVVPHRSQPLEDDPAAAANTIESHVACWMAIANVMRLLASRLEMAMSHLRVFLLRLMSCGLQHGAYWRGKRDEHAEVVRRVMQFSERHFVL